MAEPDAKTQAALYENARKRYEADVARIAASLRRLADDVERRGAALGSPLFNAPHVAGAGRVVNTVVGLHNLHLGDLVRDAAEADRYFPEEATDA